MIGSGQSDQNGHFFPRCSAKNWAWVLSYNLDYDEEEDTSYVI